MRILIDNILLADADPAAGLTLSSVSLNGERIVDEATFFRAVARSYIDREGQSVQLNLAVTREFSSLRLAQKFVLTHTNSVPGQGLIECIVGAGADVESIYLEDAVVQPQITGLQGVAVSINYTIRGGRFSTDVPDEPLPDPDDEELTVEFRRNFHVIDLGEDEYAVVFNAPFASKPTVPKPSIASPAGQPAIECTVIAESITTMGFTAKLDASTPAEGYEIHYTAFA